MGKLFDKYISSIRSTSKLRQAQFAETYKPEKTYKQRVMSDIGTLSAGLYKIPGALWGILKEQAAPPEYYKPHASFFGKFKKPTTPEGWTKLLTYSQKQSILPSLISLPYMEKIKPLQKFREKIGLPETKSMFLNKLILDSMIKGTGKWVYDPEAKGRKWLPSPKEETSRWQEYKEHPGLVGLEDIVNLSIVLGPILKPLGIGGKLAKTVAGQRVIKSAPVKAAIAGVKTTRGKMALGDIFAKIKQRQFGTIEKIYGGKLAKTLKALPEERIPEFQALLKGRAEPWTPKPVLKGMPVRAEELLTKQIFSDYAKSAALETKTLIKRGLITEKQVTGLTANEMKAMAKEFGLTIDELGKLGIKEPIYFPHIFEKHLKKSYIPAKKTPGFTLPRKGVPGWIEEPHFAVTQHKIEVYTKLNTVKAIDEIAKTFGKKIKKGVILEGYEKFKPYGELQFFRSGSIPFTGVKKAGAYKGLQVPSFVNTSLKASFNHPLPYALEKFFRAKFDPVTNTWKMSVLALSPRWIFNNIVGNTILNIAGDVRPTSYIKATRAMIRAYKQYKKGGISFERAMYRQHVPPGAWQGLYRQAARAATPPGMRAGMTRPSPAGELVQSWLVADKAPVTSMWKKLGYKLQAVPKAMYNFNSGVESFYRTAHYLDKIGRVGFDSTKALASVNEFLFNYTKMTALEKATLRRIDPFWAWHKNITRLAISYPFKHPMRAALFAKAEELVKDEKDYRFLPEYTKNYGELPFEIGGEKAYLSTRGMNPFADIFTGLSALHPALKIPIERAIGTQLWKGKQFTSPYTGYYGAGEKAVPSIWRHIISQFPHAKLIETMFRPYATYSTGQPILDKEGQIKYQKSRLLEVLKMFGINITPYDLDEMYKQGISGAMREQTVKETYAEKLRKFQQQ